MRSHRFDFFSAILGLIAAVAGIVVIAGSVTPLDAEVGPWFAALAVVFGLMLLPWHALWRRRPETPDSSNSEGLSE